MRQLPVSNVNYSTTIRVTTRVDQYGHFIMTSEDLPGLFLASKNYLALINDVPEVIRALYKDNYDMEVTVVEAGRPETDWLEDIKNPLIFSLNDNNRSNMLWQ